MGKARRKGHGRGAATIRRLLPVVLSILFVVAAGLIYHAKTGGTVAVQEVSTPAYREENGNVPYFTAEELTTTAYATYSELDALGRCGTAMACLGPELMPEAEREDISTVSPTGLKGNNNWYSFIDQGYVYNRCHLIGYQLTGENDNERNLITGTRFFNVDGMLPFENEVATYIRSTGNHVMYRVYPVFTGSNLVSDGVLMEAYSVEDAGRGISFCVYVYNIQPGVTIDYATGQNWVEGEEPLADVA